MSPSFYNPYSKNPDFSQGISEAIQQFLQMMMMKKMMGGQGQGQQQIPTSPFAGGTSTMPRQIQQPSMGGVPGMGQGGGMGGGQQQIDPQMLMQIMQLLSQLSGGRLGG